MDQAYDSAKTRKNPGYTVAAVSVALNDIAAPPECTPPIVTAFDAWAGYLMLDAWVAGRDRHHENWAAINRAGTLHLAPSYDHGNSLGFQERETRTRELAADEARLSNWINKGVSHHFVGKPSLVQVARQALQLAGDVVNDYWRSKLAETTPDDVSAIFDQIPAELMSDPGRRFRINLLNANRERILDDR